MDQVVAATGGSKATLYRYFESKEVLFRAIIDDITGSTVAAPANEDWSRVGLEEGLQILGRAVAAGALNDRTIVLLQLALGEHSRFPELGQTLFDHGPRVSYDRLTRFLTAKREERAIAIDDPQIAAEQFLGGIVGHQQLRKALGVNHASPPEIESRIDAAITAFVAAYKTEATPSTAEAGEVGHESIGVADINPDPA